MQIQRKNHPLAERLLGIIVQVENFLLILFMSAIALSIFLGAVFRYGLERPLTWSGELALISFSWAVFMGAAVAFRENRHMSIDACMKFVPPAIRRLLDKFISVLIILVLVVLVVFGIRHSLYSFNVKTTALQLPWTFVFLSIPFASVLMLFHAVDNFFGWTENPYRADGAACAE